MCNISPPINIWARTKVGLLLKDSPQLLIENIFPECLNKEAGLKSNFVDREDQQKQIVTECGRGIQNRS